MPAPSSSQSAPSTPADLSDAIVSALEAWSPDQADPSGVRPVKRRHFREVWRLTVAGKPAYLKWFPRDGGGWRERLKRRFTGSPALTEYRNLVALQEARIPAPRAAALLSGLTLHGRKGDAVLSWAIEPAEPLDEILQRHRRNATPFPDRRAFFNHVVGLLQQLQLARLGHKDLHFGNFLHRPLPTDPHALFLLDAYAVHPGGLSRADLLVLGHSAQAHATRSELLRGWKRLVGAPDDRKRPPLPPLANPVSKRQWRKSVERMTSPGDGAVDRVRFTPPNGSEYRGLCFTRQRFPWRYAPASHLTLSPADWARELPRLWEQLRAETLQPLKRSPSGDVWAGEVVLAGVPIEVVIKRPYRRKLYRYLTEIGRGSRTWRAWWKSWALIARGIPAAWPLLFLERRTAGAVTDQLLICERVPGTQLDRIDLRSLAPDDRDRLLRRVGRLLRRIDDTGLVHFDTKASNILIRPDLSTGPTPVLVDVDGVRTYTWRGEGLRRLLRSMRDHHPHFTDADAASLTFGYDPWRRAIHERAG